MAYQDAIIQGTLPPVLEKLKVLQSTWIWKLRSHGLECPENSWYMICYFWKLLIG